MRVAQVIRENFITRNDKTGKCAARCRVVRPCLFGASQVNTNAQSAAVGHAAKSLHAVVPAPAHSDN
jgi:hypothetical protein